MSVQMAPVAQNELSKDESVVNAYHTSCQCYFRPETCDIIFLTDNDANDFDELSNKLAHLMDALEKCRAKYSEALEVYYKKRNDIAKKDQLSGYFDAVISPELDLEKAVKEIQKQVGEFDEQTGYTQIFEFIPLEPLKKGMYGRFYCYLKKSDYEALQSRLTIISLKKFGTEDFYQRDEDGNITGIDKDEIAERLKKVKESLNSMASGNQLLSIEAEYEKNLTDWADAWNSQEAYSKEGLIIDVTAGAQFMRFTSNAGAKLEWSPDSGKGQIIGEAQAEFILASAYADATFYQPDRGGWQLKFVINDDNKEANLGVLRSKIEVGLTGYAGASAKIEGNLQFVTCNGKQSLMGLRAPFSSINQRRDGVDVETEKEAPISSSVSAELFAGAKGGGKFGGALQWLKPFNSLVEHLPDMLRTFGLETSLLDTKVLDKVLAKSPQPSEETSSVGTFTDFATFSSVGEVQAGIGVSGEFKFVFENGKFKFTISGGICLGLGAKGSAKGEITPQQFTEFAVWAIYQLYGMDYKHFKVFTKEAFKLLTYILLMGGVNIYREYYAKMEADARSVREDFSSFMEKLSEDITSAVEESSRRNEFAKTINQSPSNVFLLTPEGKGISLFLLIQDGSYDRIDLNNHKLASFLNGEENEIFPLPDTGHERKKAVLTILSSVQTKREWVEVMIRMTDNGEKIAGAIGGNLSEELLVKHQEDLIRNFLTIGINQDHKLNVLINQLDMRNFQELYQRLKSKPAFGYPFAPNCTKQYALYCGDSPWYASLCHVYPEDPTIKNYLKPVKK